MLVLASRPVFQWFFLTVGMLSSRLLRRIRRLTPYSMGLVFGLYILNACGGMIGGRSLKIVSPFTHFAGPHCRPRGLGSASAAEQRGGDGPIRRGQLCALCPEGHPLRRPGGRSRERLCAGTACACKSLLIWRAIVVLFSVVRHNEFSAFATIQTC